MPARFTVDWGDGSAPSTGHPAGALTRTYAKSGTYTVKVTNETGGKSKTATVTVPPLLRVEWSTSKTLLIWTTTVKVTKAPAGVSSVTAKWGAEAASSKPLTFTKDWVLISPASLDLVITAGTTSITCAVSTIGGASGVCEA